MNIVRKGKLQSPLENVIEVKKYYDHSTRWYKWFYFDRESLAMHYRFWDTPNISRKKALLNQYIMLKDYLQPGRGQVILDSGCGVGGASLWLARNTAADYVGITLSDIQLRMANGYAKKRGLSGRIKFFQKSYFQTDFEDEKFDHIFGLESFCYAYPNPQPLYKEMYRMLKPGGKMVVSDGILLRKPSDDREWTLANDFCKGFKMLGWNTPEEITSHLQKAGFENIQFIDKTRQIARSVVDIWKRSKLVSPFRILKYVGLVAQSEVENLFATRSQKLMYDFGPFGYGVFVANKPTKLQAY